jgi:rubrerythrin
MDQTTRDHLQVALAGEALAQIRYRLFADEAEEEGYDAVAYLFERIGRQERRQHARQIAALLDLVGPTRENLETALAAEKAEHRRIYPRYAAEARHHGDLDAAQLFQELGADEAAHADEIREALDEMAPAWGASHLVPDR